jgi:hypothetical protein
MTRLQHWQGVVSSILEPVLALDPRIGEKVAGCTPEDIATIERKLAVTLPAAVVALLTRIGRHPGELFLGDDFGFPGILELRSTAEALLQEQEGLGLFPSDIVFSMHQGYQFFFFSAAAGDDPPLFFYNDDDPRFVSTGWSFTEWLRVCMDEATELWTGRLKAEAAAIDRSRRGAHAPSGSGPGEPERNQLGAIAFFSDGVAEMDQHRRIVFVPREQLLGLSLVHGPGAERPAVVLLLAAIALAASLYPVVVLLNRLAYGGVLYVEVFWLSAALPLGLWLLQLALRRRFLLVAHTVGGTRKLILGSRIPPEAILPFLSTVRARLGYHFDVHDSAARRLAAQTRSAA